MSRYYCETCDLLLYAHETDLREESDVSEFWGQRATTYITFRVCAACGEEVEEANEDIA